MKFLKEILIAKKKGLESIKSGLFGNKIDRYKKDLNENRQSNRFTCNISSDRVNIIGEIKKASPSLGMINSSLDIAKTAGAYNRFASFLSGISVLTEPLYFKGSGEDIALAKRSGDLPVLRKDFIFSELQLYESAELGADCILLISSLLGSRKLRKLHKCAGELGLDVLIETHSYEELKKTIDMDADLIGINNRDLKNMKVDSEHIIRLLNKLPPGSLSGVKLVCESGINDIDYIERLYSIGVSTFLIGTHFMQSLDLESTLEETRKGLASRGLI